MNQSGNSVVSFVETSFSLLLGGGSKKVCRGFAEVPTTIPCPNQQPCWDLKLGNGPNTVSGSTVSNTGLSEFLCPHRVPGRELSEFLSAYYLCAKNELTEFFSKLTEFAQNSVRLSEFSFRKQYSRNSIPPVS